MNVYACALVCAWMCVKNDFLHQLMFLKMRFSGPVITRRQRNTRNTVSTARICECMHGPEYMVLCVLHTLVCVFCTCMSHTWHVTRVVSVWGRTSVT